MSGQSVGGQDWGKFMLKSGVKVDTPLPADIALLVRTPADTYGEMFAPWLIRRVREALGKHLITDVVELWENVAAGETKTG